MKLKDIAIYANDRVEVKYLSDYNYISTENMIPEKGGIQNASSLPSMPFTSAFIVDDVLISNIRPYFRKIWFADKRGGCSNDVLVLRAQEKCYPKFLYYVLSNNRFFDYSTASAKGTKMPRGDKSAIMEYEVPDFDRTEQIKIAKILSSFDDKIELNHRINDNLEQQAQALFKSWFVDFEPFKNGKFVDSELGMIPEGWKVGHLDEVCDIVGGGTPSKARQDYYCSNGIAWITPKDLSITKAKFTSHGEVDITSEGYASSSSKLMPKGTILFSSRAPIGYISIALNDICTNQGFKSLIPKIAGTCYLYCYLKENIDNIERQATGSTFKEASGSLMKRQLVIIPSNNDIFKDFEDVLLPIFRKQEKNESENQILESYRDSLLPKLMSGEIKINDLHS